MEMSAIRWVRLSGGVRPGRMMNKKQGEGQAADQRHCRPLPPGDACRAAGTRYAGAQGWGGLWVWLPLHPHLAFLPLQQFSDCAWDSPRALIKTDSWVPQCPPVFIAALFTIARTWKQPGCPLTDEWIKKCGAYIYHGILLSHKKDQIWVSSSEVDEPRSC